MFDFGTGTAGEFNAPGGTANGTDYLLLSAQVGANQATKRLSMKGRTFFRRCLFPARVVLQIDPSTSEATIAVV